MMMESCPFDIAAERPLLAGEEPVKKRWSWLSNDSTSTTTTSASSSSGFSIAYRNDCGTRSTPPDIHIIEFDAHEEYGNVDASLFDSAQMWSKLEQGMINADIALMRERHEHIGEINVSMKHICDIQKDIALVVDQQGDNIDRLESMAMESLHHSSEGISQLLKMQRQVTTSGEKHQGMLAAALVVLLFVIARYLN